jgi:hypothetical protein
LASGAVDIEMEELARQTRLIAAILHGAPEHVELPQLGIPALCQQPERRTGRKDSSRAGSFLDADDEGTATRDPDAAGLGDLGAAGGWRDPWVRRARLDAGPRDPHARERALVIARQDPPFGVSPDEAVAAGRDVLDSIGDTCPECPPAD